MRKTGSVQLPLRGTYILPEFIMWPLVVAVVEQMGRGNDVGYIEYGVFPECNWVVAVNLLTVAFWQHACCNTVAAYRIAGYRWPSSKQPPTNYNENGSKGLPYTYWPWCNHFFPHVLQTCTVCFFITNVSSSKWAEKECAQVMCTTVQPCYRHWQLHQCIT